MPSALQPGPQSWRPIEVQANGAPALQACGRVSATAPQRATRCSGPARRATSRRRPLLRAGSHAPTARDAEPAAAVSELARNRPRGHLAASVASVAIPPRGSRSAPPGCGRGRGSLVVGVRARPGPTGGGGRGPRRGPGPVPERADRVLRDPHARPGVDLPLPRRRRCSPPRLRARRARPRRWTSSSPSRSRLRRLTSDQSSSTTGTKTGDATTATSPAPKTSSGEPPPRSMNSTPRSPNETPDEPTALHGNEVPRHP